MRRLSNDLTHFSSRGHMQFNFKKPISGLIVLAALSCAMSVYSENHNVAPRTFASNQFSELPNSLKVENISRDYSNAHIELMKKPDEVTISAF
jgi:type IV secretory pathway protease TraF